jgi:hypothetical protein
VAVVVDTAGLERHAREAVAPRLEKAAAEVRHQPLQGIASGDDGLAHESVEAHAVLLGQHEGVHDVLAGVVHTDEQTRLVAADADDLAIDAEDPAPTGWRQLGGHHQWGLGRCAGGVDPTVEGEP